MICILFFITSCCGKTVNSDEIEEVKVDSASLFAIDQRLLSELNEFIYEVVETNEYDYKIIGVSFYQQDEECFIAASPTHFYYSKHLDGYIVINGKMIAFYNTTSICNSFVDVSKLKKDKPKEFLDIPNVTYDSIGKILKIHIDGSLELIKRI